MASNGSKVFVDASPYPWPYDGDLRKENTCIIVIDMQNDFCSENGYVHSMGYDLSLMRKPIQPIQAVLKCLRAEQYHILHTREGHRPDLSDCPPNKLWRSKQIGAEIGSSQGPSGSRILIQGQPGWEIIPELAPIPGEIVIDKPGKGSFVGTSLDLILRSNGIQNIILAGVTTGTCVRG
jgi:biuret amidohydrolase